MSDEYLRFRLRYRPRSPLRVGYRKVGNLQTTRYYVPGNNLWASAVCALAAAFGPRPGGANAYDFWGRWLLENARFSYFFLVEGEGEGRNLLIPHVPPYPGETGPAAPGSASSADVSAHIERHYIYSTVSTALQYDSNTKQDGSLHEMEWISHRDRVTGRPTHLEGFVDLRRSAVRECPEDPDGKPAHEPVFREAAAEGGQPREQWSALRLHDGTGRQAGFFTGILGQARVGGDRSYGYGRLERVANGVSLCEDGPGGVSGQTARQPAPGHVEASAPGVVGRIETVVGRTWVPAAGCDAGTPRAPGRYSTHLVAYLPGSLADMRRLTMHPLGWFYDTEAIQAAG